MTTDGVWSKLSAWCFFAMDKSEKGEEGSKVSDVHCERWRRCEERYDFSLWVRLGTYKQCSVPIGTWKEVTSHAIPATFRWRVSGSGLACGATPTASRDALPCVTLFAPRLQLGHDIYLGRDVFGCSWCQSEHAPLASPSNQHSAGNENGSAPSLTHTIYCPSRQIPLFSSLSVMHTTVRPLPLAPQPVLCIHLLILPIFRLPRLLQFTNGVFLLATTSFDSDVLSLTRLMTRRPAVTYRFTSTCSRKTITGNACQHECYHTLSADLRVLSPRNLSQLGKSTGDSTHRGPPGGSGGLRCTRQSGVSCTATVKYIGISSKDDGRAHR
jgi:hypothetical protein